MADEQEEERRLQSVALRNAQSILLAREQAERELLSAKEALEHRSQELARSLALLRATLESTTDGILVTDDAGKVTGANEKYALMWRLPPELKLRDHRGLLETLASQLADPQGYRARIEEIYASAPPETFDVLELSDGRVFERSSRVQVVDELPVGRVWSFRDVTERRRTEEALSRQSELLRITLASIGDAVISTDADGRVSFLNRMAEELTGWSLHEAVGRPLVEIFHIVNQLTREPVENPALRALRDGKVVGLANHTILVARNGAERIIDDSAAPICTPEGSIIGAVLVFRDVTARAHSAQIQAQLAAIVASSQDAVISKTLDGVIQSWNAEAERMFGYTAEEAVGKHITMIIPPERRDEETEIMRRLRLGERVNHFETERVAKDGHLIELSLTISPVLDESGAVIGASKVARDITDRRRAEVLLRDSDRRKDEFLALLAHELRNPLAPLRNGLEILRIAGAEGAMALNAKEMMERQLTHLVRLVDDLLDVSRISRGKMELRRSRVALVEILNSAVETARPAIEDGGHQLTILLPPEPIHILADSVRLAQVFGNLLANSAKYTRRGGRIWLAAERRDDEVVVSVKDTGVGIPEDSLNTIFNMFSQVDRGIERSTGGLGIGLALVRGLVEMHGGIVRAESDGLGRGSTFTVRLPIPRGAEDEVASLPPPKTAGQGSKRRILLADDNRDAVHSMSTLLKLLGNEVYVAYDGVEACEAAERYAPDVVLMDIGMPRLNGYEATRRIRAQPWSQGMLIIALTGWGQESDRLKAQEAGCDAHLVKPVNVWQLEATFSRLKGGSAARKPE